MQVTQIHREVGEAGKSERQPVPLVAHRICGQQGSAVSEVSGLPLGLPQSTTRLEGQLRVGAPPGLGSGLPGLSGGALPWEGFQGWGAGSCFWAVGLLHLWMFEVTCKWTSLAVSAPSMSLTFFLLHSAKDWP